MRGPLSKTMIEMQLAGITPACAGTTPSAGLPRLYQGDHPRMCGDHHENNRPNWKPYGSPPHVRGPRFCFSTSISVLGITPACAGTTKEGNKWRMAEWDHPRMCGDHDPLALLQFSVAGSPPHVRGPLTPELSFWKCPGITPACAGTTRHSWKPHNATWDHPRMCGDHSFRSPWLFG